MARSRAQIQHRIPYAGLYVQGTQNRENYRTYSSTHRSGRLLDFEVLSTGGKYLPIELWISRFSKQDPEIRGKLRLQSTRGTGDTKLVSISTDSSLVPVIAAVNVPAYLRTYRTHLRVRYSSILFFLNCRAAVRSTSCAEFQWVPRTESLKSKILSS